MKKYYLVKVLYSEKEIFFIWYSNDTDGFIAKQNRVLVFKSENEAIHFAGNSSIVLEEGITSYDIIDFSNIVNKINTVVLSENCRFLFDIWNMFGDIAKSSDKNFAGNAEDGLTLDIYEKLFFGCNLKAITKDMEEYHPMFDEEETEVCISIFRSGSDMLDQILQDNFD